MIASEKGAYEKKVCGSGAWGRRQSREIELMRALMDDPAASTMTDAEWNELCNERCGVIAAARD